MAHANKVAIIMDGNRRWAKKNNLPASSGHRKGIETLIEIVKSAKQNDVKNLIVYAFSTENWSRESFEVNALMNLINFGVDVKLDEILRPRGPWALQKILVRHYEKTRITRFWGLSWV